MSAASSSQHSALDPSVDGGKANEDHRPASGNHSSNNHRSSHPPTRSPTKTVDGSTSSSLGSMNGKQYPNTTLHQPHGVPAIGPAASTITQQQLYYSQQQNQHPHQGSEASPLPPMVQRSLGDRSNEKRKNAALEIEALIKSLTETSNFATVNAVIAVLSKDFCTSMNSNYRKGGLVGLAATAIGLHSAAGNFLHVLLPPVLHCFDDPESRVRYYACESIYNMAKVSRQGIMAYFNPIFEGLTKLFADVDVDVKNGANLLNRLIKDIVTEADANTFQVDQFLPVMQNYIRRTNPFIRQLIVGWITLLDSLPDFSLLVYLPDFLDGLFNMLSDSNREIRQAADSALSDFLRELSSSEVLEFGPIVSTLVVQCQSKERLNRLTSMTWLAELTHHPLSGGDDLLPFLPEILSAILYCISDHEKEIRLVADKTNDDLLQLVRDTTGTFELLPLLETLTNEMLEKEDVPTKMAALRWINMLMEKRMFDMQAYTVNLLPVLLRTLSDPSDVVVLLDLQVLSRISLAVVDNTPVTNGKFNDQSKPQQVDEDTTLKEHASSSPQPVEAQFQLVLNAILNLFAQDRQLLETRGSLIIRKLCVLLNAKAVYIRMADTLSSYECVGTDSDRRDQSTTLQFVSTMVQTLNLILLTASELHDLRSALSSSFDDVANGQNHRDSAGDANENSIVFATIFHCWCHNPVATFSLCLLARAYDLSFALVKRFSEMEDVSVGFLMQIDKLVYILESPIFVHLRLQLLNVEAPHHAHLLKSIYGILMCLPQGEAFRLLNDRLTAVCNLRDNLGVGPVTGRAPMSAVSHGGSDENGADDLGAIVGKRGLDMHRLLDRFDRVAEQHREAKACVRKTNLASDLRTSDIAKSSPMTASGQGFFSGTSSHRHHTLPNTLSMTSSFGRDRATAAYASMSASSHDTPKAGTPIRAELQKNSSLTGNRRI
jgi:vacuole morphology and inheritance protein 14